MNLLTDQWIPVHQEGKRHLIYLQDALCADRDWQLSLPRDDMEMACLQLMICLTQVIFTPKDARELKQRISQPLNVKEYQDGIAQYIDWFDLNHPDTPFMQVRGVKAEKPTPIQKLFVGLPEGNNHCFFNEPGELLQVCSSCIAIALFNQNSNAPGFSGKQKAGIRGPHPITTLVSSHSLRTMVWFNILHRDTLNNISIGVVDDLPVWIQPIIPKTEIEKYIKETKPKKNVHKRKNIPFSRIGLIRGLFWLPVLIELKAGTYKAKSEQVCDFCGESSCEVWHDFYLGSDFYFNILGNWPHPHSPRYWNLIKGKREEKFLSFNTTAPAWTQLNRFIVDARSEEEGYQSAAIISQYRQISPGRAFSLLVGGYRNKQASILQRRHEMLPLKEGWEDHVVELSQIVELALEIKSKLIQSLCLFGVMAGAAKRNKIKLNAISSNGLIKYKSHLGDYPFANFEDFFNGVHNKAEALFYQNSEYEIHETLRHMVWREAKEEKIRLLEELIRIGRRIFEDVVRPYRHEPKMIQALATARRNLEKEFLRIEGEQV